NIHLKDAENQEFTLVVEYSPKGEDNWQSLPGEVRVVGNNTLRWQSKALLGKGKKESWDANIRVVFCGSDKNCIPVDEKSYLSLTIKPFEVKTGAMKAVPGAVIWDEVPPSGSKATVETGDYDVVGIIKGDQGLVIVDNVLYWVNKIDEHHDDGTFVGWAKNVSREQLTINDLCQTSSN
ncbi:MAG: hypothetical protein D6681_04135, partial [Calditrichaeota bacterium]